MFSLFCEAKFWTLKNDVQIKNTDLSVLRFESDFNSFIGLNSISTVLLEFKKIFERKMVFRTSSKNVYYLYIVFPVGCRVLTFCRYYDKKEIDECPYFEGKKLYCSQRGTEFILKNKRPFKLKDRLKELEQQLINNKIVFFNWKDDNILHLILNTGLIIIIGVNTHSKDIYKIVFDRFLIGKLLSDYICDVLATKTHLVVSYNENQLTVINFSKPLTRYNPPEKIAKLEPKIHHVDLCGPSGRRLDRKLSCSKLGDSILTWWQSTRNEVYPWSPLVKDEDRANVHIYSLIGTKIELLCFYRTEFDLMSVNFSKIKPNVVWLIEQKVLKKGDVTIEYSSYEIVKKVFKKISFSSIPLQTQICCHSISPDEERLVLGCIDGSLILFDEPRGVTRLVKSAFIPNLVSWHNDGAFIVIANERNQFQFFDLALSCIKTQLLSDEVTPSNVLDLTSFFKLQPILLHINWNKKANATYYIDRFIPNDHLLLLIFENGPLGVLNVIGGGGLSNDVQNSGLTPDILIRQYLLWNQSDKALNVLLSLNWNTNGSSCLAGLYHIANHIFRHPFIPEAEIQLELALGSFYAPVRSLTRLTEKEFGNQVHDLTRRFFHLLLRHQLFEKAYCLAIDLSNADLFVDLYHCAKLLEDEEMALACIAKIEDLNGISESSHSSCSHSLCSCSECYTEDEEDGILPPLPQVSVKKSKASKVPPLPDLNRHNKLRESAFFNCNSTYLQLETEQSNGFDSQAVSTSYNESYPTFIKSVPKNVDFKYSTTQILTPEFPHSYEIRTSFTEQDTNMNNFVSSDPNLGTQKNTNPPLFRTNVIESLYDLPLNLHLSGQNELRKDLFPNRLDPSNSNFGSLKLKSPQNQFHASNALCSSKIGPFDNLSPLGPRILFNEDKPSLLNPVNFNQQYRLPRNFSSRPSSYVPPSKHFNKFMLQRPPHFVPNAFPRQDLRPVCSAMAKQKVKFSDTVTHIVVPDLSKISIEDETLTSQYKSRNSRNVKATVISSGSSSDLPQDVGNLNSGKECNRQREQLEEEENNGSIKVIHFGIV